MIFMKKKLLEFIPPIITKKIARRKWRFIGDYPSWEKAKIDSSGYEAKSVIEGIESKFKEWLATREAEAGKKKTLFLDHADKTLLSAIIPVMMHIRKNEIRVLDIGGSLGGHYIVVRDLTPKWINIQWDIIETTSLAHLANTSYPRKEVKWYDNLNDVREREYDIVFSSGTLQCLPNPEETLEFINKISHQYLILNRLPLIDSHRDRLTIQIVPKSYYSGSYPSWFFSSSKWLDIFSKYYTSMYYWHIENHEVYLDKLVVTYSGYVFKRNALEV
jgi:putative methyltransferase (TIGR04325 family)